MPIAEHKKTGAKLLSPLKESLEAGSCLVLTRLPAKVEENRATTI
jgi:hypothetical protein